MLRAGFGRPESGGIDGGQYSAKSARGQQPHALRACFRCGGRTVDQIIDVRAEHGGKANQHLDVGARAACLVVRDGLARHEQARGQIVLRETFLLAQRADVLPDVLFRSSHRSHLALSIPSALPSCHANFLCIFIRRGWAFGSVPCLRGERCIPHRKRPAQKGLCLPLRGRWVSASEPGRGASPSPLRPFGPPPLRGEATFPARILLPRGLRLPLRGRWVSASEPGRGVSTLTPQSPAGTAPLKGEPSAFPHAGDGRKGPQTP